jgi:hypothetical protein
MKAHTPASTAARFQPVRDPNFVRFDPGADKGSTGSETLTGRPSRRGSQAAMP